MNTFSNEQKDINEDHQNPVPVKYDDLIIRRGDIEESIRKKFPNFQKAIQQTAKHEAIIEEYQERIEKYQEIIKKSKTAIKHYQRVQRRIASNIAIDYDFLTKTRSEALNLTGESTLQDKVPDLEIIKKRKRESEEKSPNTVIKEAKRKSFFECFKTKN